MRLHTLGRLGLEGSKLTRPKPLLLLCYLALESPQNRRHLAELFWPRASDHMNSLTVALAQLRQGAPGALEADERQVEAYIESDAKAFLERLEHGELEAALELYQGPFLEGFYLKDWSEELEEWVYATRERLAGQACAALLTLGEREAAKGDFAEAAKRAEAAFELRGSDLLEPEDLTRLHRLLAAGHSPYAAEVTKEAESLGVALSRSVADAQARLQTSAPPLAARALPAPATTFVGREQDLAELERLLAEPDCRLLTLVGPGGIGKTRLALEAAARSAFSHGVFFAPLASVGAEMGVVPAIAEAVGFRFYAEAAPERQLLDYLRGKHMLLVLDNFEHLLAGAGFVAELLNASALKLLVTSRERLHLQEEWVYPVEGLSFPREGSEPEGQETYDALRLFESCARRARVRFPLEAQEEGVKRICQLVEGMPLALELAASWLHVMPLSAIVRELESGIDVLTARHQDLPERHRSLRAVLEGSWQLLSNEERSVLERLSVFRGFRRKAAERIAGAGLSVLATLVEKSLLRVGEEGRYTLHELLRQFALERLAENAATEAAALEAHSRYYLGFLRASEESLTGQNQRQALDEVAEELDNVRAAWRWALRQNDLLALERAVDGSYHFFQVRSRYQEGEELFAQTAAHLSLFSSPDPAAPAALSGRVRARRGAFCYFLGAYEAAERHLQPCLAEAREIGDPRETAFILNFLGQLAAWRGDKSAAKDHLSESLALSRAAGDKSGAAFAQEKLANLIHATFGEYAESKSLAAQSLALSRELGRPDWSAYALDTLGFAAFCLGEYEAAEAHYRESLALFEASGDRYGMSMALGGVGLVLWAVGGEKTLQAASYLEKSLAVCRDIGHQGQIAGRLAGLARVANDLGEFDEAMSHARAGLAIARSLDSPVYLSHLLCCLGETACALGQFGAARVYLAEALQLTFATRLLAYLATAIYHYGVLLVGESDEEPVERLEKRVKALELFTVVSRHPACWRVFKDRAEARSARLGAELPETLAQEAKARGERLMLEQLAGELGLARA